ncbi:MAG: NUDIX domain-containing protein, partial [Deltaproteobacteria bacterium]
MSRWFFYGTLRDDALRAVVLGRNVACELAVLQGWQVVNAREETFPVLMPDHHGTADGVIVYGLTSSEEARLAFYEEPFGYEMHDLTVSGAKARLYMPPPQAFKPGQTWDFAAWLASEGALTIETAKDYMAAFGNNPADKAARHYEMIVQRAASRLRAKATPLKDTERTGAGTIDASSERLPYLGYFAVRETSLQFQRFNGEMSNTIHRSGFMMGDAVTVLPYDPKRDRVMVVEQFRYGPYLRGDHNPWTLEPIAGRIDPGETPEQAARREAVEEAHLTLGRLILVAQYYPS